MPKPKDENRETFWRDEADRYLAERDDALARLAEVENLEFGLWVVYWACLRAAAEMDA